MKLYYKAISQDGSAIQGLIDAKNEREVATYLRNHKLTPVKIIPASKRGFAQFNFLKKPKLKDRIFFTRQLSSMLNSGLTLMQAMEIIKNQMPNPIFADILKEIIAEIESGKLFSDALEKYPDLFPPVYIALIRTAETSGLLDKTLLRLSDNLEKQDRLQRTIKGALMYPAIVVVIMFLVVMIMMLFVVPQLQVLYSSINIPLPFSTRFVLGISNIFVKVWYLIIIGIFATIYYIRKWHKGVGGARIIDGLILKVPVFGKLMMQSLMAEFTRTLGLLIGAGSLVIDSLVKSSDVAGNVLYKDAIMLVSKRVEKGITMGSAMEASPLFPPMVVEMVKIGEQTGKLEDSLMRASEYFEREVDETVKNLTTLLEPIIIVVLALGVGFLIYSIITPIYGLISSIK